MLLAALRLPRILGLSRRASHAVANVVHTVKDFFISYTKADRTWAEWIAWQLEAAGSSVIVQAWDFRPGSNFVLDMQWATAEATRTVAVLSPDYLASHYTHPEWAAAFAQYPQKVSAELACDVVDIVSA